MNDGMKIMELLKDVNGLMEKGLKKYFSNHEITVPQLAVVNILGKKEKVRINDLSEELKITPAAVSGIVDRLEAHGLLERVRSHEDRRVVYVKLTEGFKSAHGNLDHNLNSFLTLLLRSEEEAEVKKIVDGLEGLKKILESSDVVISKHISRK